MFSSLFKNRKSIFMCNHFHLLILSIWSWFNLITGVFIYYYVKVPVVFDLSVIVHKRKTRLLKSWITDVEMCISQCFSIVVTSTFLKALHVPCMYMYITAGTYTSDDWFCGLMKLLYVYIWTFFVLETLYLWITLFIWKKVNSTKRLSSLNT